MDTSYTNNYLFYCETFGGLHYFLSQDAKNFSGISNLPGCDYQISAITRTERGGYEQFQRSYPYEFRPPALTVDSLDFYCSYRDVYQTIIHPTPMFCL
jgi:hypothetical protein